MSKTSSIVTTIAPPGTGPNKAFSMAFAGDRGFYIGQNDYSMSDARVFKISQGGTRTTVAGAASLGDNDGPSAVAKFKKVTQMAVDTSGAGDVIYATDTDNHAIRKIDVGAGQVTTFIGRGSYGCDDGPRTGVYMGHPRGIVKFPSSGPISTLYFIGCGRKLAKYDFSTDVVSTVISRGTSAGIDGPIGTAQFTDNIEVLVLESSGRVLYALEKSTRSVVRRLDLNAGLVTTVVGPIGNFRDSVDGIGRAARISEPKGLTIDPLARPPVLYLTTEGYHQDQVRAIRTDNFEVTTVAGRIGYATAEKDGAAITAKIMDPQGLVFDTQASSKTIYLITQFGSVRKIVDPSQQNVRSTGPVLIQIDDCLPHPYLSEHCLA